MMDFQDIMLATIGFSATCLVGIVSWFISYIFGRFEQHEKVHSKVMEQCGRIGDALDQHKLYSAQTYATKIDVKETEAIIVAYLSRIEGKLDTKMDKDFCRDIRSRFTTKKGDTPC